MNIPNPKEQAFLHHILGALEPADVAYAVLLDERTVNLTEKFSLDRAMVGLAVSIILDLYSADSAESDNLQRVLGGIDHAISKLATIKTGLKERCRLEAGWR